MPYNPGIAARGELLGLSIGAAGQSIAQSYGEGLKLQEEQDRYNKKEKQRKKDRRNLEKANEVRAGVLIDAQYPENPEAAKKAKEATQAMDPGELEGWLQGQAEAMARKSQQTNYAVNTLKLGMLEKDIAGEEGMSDAMKLMATFRVDYDRSWEDSLAYTIQQSDLSPKNQLLLTQLSGAQQKVEYEGRGLQLRALSEKNRGDAIEIDKRNAKTMEAQQDYNDKLLAKRIADESKPPSAAPVAGLPGSYVVDLGGKKQLVTGAAPDPMLEMEKRTLSESVDKKVKTAYEEADQIARGGGEELKEVKGGDERTGWGTSRYDRLAGQLTELEAASSQYKAKTGKEHPGLKSFYDRVGSLVMHMREQGRDANDIKRILQSVGFKRKINQLKSEGRDKEAKELAAKFGIDLTR